MFGFARIMFPFHVMVLSVHFLISFTLPQGWSVALVHASCLAVAFSLTGLSLLGQVIIDMEVLSRQEHVS